MWRENEKHHRDDDSGADLFIPLLWELVVLVNYEWQVEEWEPFEVDQLNGQTRVDESHKEHVNCTSF